MSTSTLVAPSLKNKNHNTAPSFLPSYHIFICCSGIGRCDVSHSTILSKKDFYPKNTCKCSCSELLALFFKGSGLNTINTSLKLLSDILLSWRSCSYGSRGPVFMYSSRPCRCSTSTWGRCWGRPTQNPGCGPRW